MPWNFRATGWGNAGAALRDSHSTRRGQFEEPLFNGPILLHSSISCSASRHQLFRAGMESLTGRLGFGCVLARDRLRH